MNSLDLAWKSFEFYSHKIEESESLYQTYHFVLDSHIDEMIQLDDREKKDLKNNLLDTINSLHNLYRKQMQSLDDILNNTPNNTSHAEHKKLGDYHLASPDSINTLKSLTLDLISQLEIDKNNIKEYLH